MLAAAAIWSLYTWLLRVHRPPLPAMVLLFGQIALGSVFTIACALVEWSVFAVPSRFDVPRAWGVLAYVAILPSVVGYLLWDRGVARAGATLPMFFTNLTPVFAALMSAVLLGESPQPYHGVALVLILLGIRLVGKRA
jgi:drug/metabolite transporter (DMT)-like permease